jgi:hypothetical protein
MAEFVLFVGPSGHGLTPDQLGAPEFRIAPPARRGDVDGLVSASGEPGVIVVCDGVFQTAPAVSHAELCRAIDAGWKVWGVSSLGAIRAHELRGEGMHGYGWVYAQFGCHADFTDDELCLLHFPQEPWFPVSEPLVNLRYALAMQGPAVGLAPTAADQVVQAARRLWFGDRTEDRLRALLRDEGGLPAPAVAALWGWLTRHRVKTLDLAALMAQQPWRQALPRASTAPSPASPPPASPRPPP